ncbi:MAG TPA: TIGR00730 family Rossman fold protein, partial [Terriglobales bacterium]|nr:TIGR00730 family Rossman fold protein [Terriglobales bacterium]
TTRAPLAYQNERFLDTPEARPLRIVAEYLEPLQRLRRENIQDTIVFFGSARILSRDAALARAAQANPESKAIAERAVEMSRYYEDARELAKRLTVWAEALPSRRRRFVVTSGGGPGIMQAANMGAHEGGGKTVGFNIRLPFEQTPNPYISQNLNFEFHYFFMRKFWFAYLAKALIAFPGGFGTLDEIMEVLTLAQTQKLKKKMVALMYGREYWNQVINFQALVDCGTISAEDLNLFHFADTPEEAFDILTRELDQLYLRPTAVEEEAPQIARTNV